MERQLDLRSTGPMKLTHTCAPSKGAVVHVFVRRSSPAPPTKCSSSSTHTSVYRTWESSRCPLRSCRSAAPLWKALQRFGVPVAKRLKADGSSFLIVRHNCESG